jgi:two-component system nitrate/nitrite response regulator NarL
MRLAICDDEPIFVEAMASVFRARGHDVTGTTDTAELLAVLDRDTVDVCIVDLFFAATPAIETIRRLVAEHPSVATIVLTGFPEPAVLDVLRPLAGLMLLSKSADLAQIVQTVELRARGPVVGGRWQAVPTRGQGWNERLTDREREVLVLLANGANTAGIARALGMREPTARSHIQNVLQKLGVHSRVEAVSVAVLRELVSSVDLRPGPRQAGA